MTLPHRFAPVLLIALSLLGIFFLTGNENVWITLFCMVAMILALTILIVYEDASLFFVTIFFINHVMFLDGGTYSSLMLTGSLLTVSPAFLFLKKPVRILPLLLPLSLLAFYYLLVIVLKPYAPKPSWAWLHLWTALVYVMTQFFTWDTDRIVKVSRAYMIALIIFGIVEVTLFYKPRIEGPGLGATAYGILLVISWAVCCSYDLLKTKPRYVAAVLYTIPAVAVMIATGTRMTFVGIAAALIMILFVRSVIMSRGSTSRKLTVFCASGAVAALMAIAVWTALPQDLTIKQNFQSILRGEIDPSNAGRILSWHCAILAFRESPLLGIGNGNFMRFFQKSYGDIPMVPTWMLGMPHSHNVTLIVLGDNGLVGIATALAIVCLALIPVFKIIKKHKSENTAYSLIIGFAVMYLLSMVDAVPYYPPSIIWGAWFFGALAQLRTEREGDTPRPIPSAAGV